MTEMSRRGLVIVVGAGTLASAFGLAHPFGSATVEQGQRHRTSFGSVTLLGSARVAAATAGAHGAAHAAHAATVAGRAADVPVGSRVHGAWTDAVVVDLDVRNDRTQLLGLSPGQFRLRVGATGPTVSLYSADRDARVLAAGAAARMRITYLAPPPDQELSVEFDDPGAGARLVLGRVGARAGVALA
jgi:hypothetical protein